MYIFKRRGQIVRISTLPKVDSYTPNFTFVDEILEYNRPTEAYPWCDSYEVSGFMGNFMAVLYFLIWSDSLDGCTGYKGAFLQKFSRVPIAAKLMIGSKKVREV